MGDATVISASNFSHNGPYFSFLVLFPLDCCLHLIVEVKIQLFCNYPASVCFIVLMCRACLRVGLEGV